MSLSLSQQFSGGGLFKSKCQMTTEWIGIIALVADNEEIQTLVIVWKRTERLGIRQVLSLSDCGFGRITLPIWTCFLVHKMGAVPSTSFIYSVVQQIFTECCFGYLLLHNKLPLNLVSQNITILLYLMILWLKGLGRAQLGDLLLSMAQVTHGIQLVDGLVWRIHNSSLTCLLPFGGWLES